MDESLQRNTRKIRPRENEAIASVSARFSYLDESGKQCWADINPPRFKLGRLSDNNLILNPLAVSRSHAEVLIQNGEYLLRDLDSKLGTYLNGVRVKQASLTDGDRVQLGGSQGISLTFHTGDILQSLLSSSDSDGFRAFSSRI